MTFVWEIAVKVSTRNNFNNSCNYNSMPKHKMRTEREENVDKSISGFFSNVRSCYLFIVNAKHGLTGQTKSKRIVWQNSLGGTYCAVRLYKHNPFHDRQLFSIEGFGATTG